MKTTDGFLPLANPKKLNHTKASYRTKKSLAVPAVHSFARMWEHSSGCLNLVSQSMSPCQGDLLLLFVVASIPPEYDREC